MAKNLCVIPARGGSKRITKKNIKNFLGKPIIAYSIEAALNSGLFEEVMVSTDDGEIAEIARHYGAEVPFLRSKKNADDFAPIVDVLLEVLADYKVRNRDFINLCCIYPTAPFTSSEKLIVAFKKLQNNDLDLVLPVIPFNYPIQRALKLIDKKLSFFHPGSEKFRSQDLEKAFHDAGQFYFLKTAAFLLNKSLILECNEGLVYSQLEVQDINDEIDWKMAEIKYGLLQSTK